MEITFGKLLSILDSNIIKRSASYELFQIGDAQYSFYLYNEKINCFSFKHFRELTIHEFFEEHFPYTELELEVIKNKKESYEFQLSEAIPTAKMIGRVLLLKNVMNIDRDETKDSLFISFIRDNEFMTRNYNWFLSYNKMFYFVQQDILIEFNASQCKYKGLKSHEMITLKQGSSLLHLIYLSPYTMFEDYENKTLGNEHIHLNFNQKQYSKEINPKEDNSITSKILIRSTLYELKRALEILFEENYVERDQTIEIHFPGTSHSVFHNRHYNKINKQIRAQISYFENFAQDSELSRTTTIKSKRSGNYIYAILEIPINITTMSVILEHFQDMKSIIFENINYTQLSIIEGQVGEPTTEDNFNEVPDYAFNIEDHE